MFRRADALSLALTCLLARPAAAQPCIAPEAKRALAACPGGKVDAAGGERPRPAFSAAPSLPELRRPEADLGIGPVPPGVAALVHDAGAGGSETLASRPA